MFKIKLGQAFIEITANADKLHKGLKDAESKIESSVNKISNKLSSIGKGMTLVGGAITLISVGLVKAASDAEETASKFAVVFKDVADEANKSAKNLSDNFGLSSNAAKKLLSDTGDLLTGFGFTGKAALDLSKQVNELAVDLASFTNYSGGAEGASQALTKALLGERESVKSLGISILETDVKTKMLEMSKQGLTFETERQAKAYATLLIAQEQSKNAMGDFARTQDSFANQMRILKARISDLVVELGDKLLPIATELISKITNIVIKVTEWVKSHETLVGWIVRVTAVLGALAAVGGPILMAVAAFMKLKVALDIVKTAIPLVTNVITGASGLNAAVLLVTANIIIWKQVLDDINKVLKMGYTSTKDVTDAQNMFAEMQAKTAEKLGLTVEEFIKMQKEGKSVSEMMGISAEETAASIGILKKSNEDLQRQMSLLTKEFEVSNKELDESKKYYEEMINLLSQLEVNLQLEIMNMEKYSEAWYGQKEAIAEVQKKIKDITGDLENLGEEYKKALEEIADRIYELTHTELENNIKKLDEQKQAYINLGISVEEVNTWYDEEIKKLNELEEEKSDAKRINEELAESYKSLTDRIYELTHTDMENAIYKLDQQKQAYIDLGVSIELINKWYDAEIAKLKEANVVIDEHVDKLEEATVAMENVGILGGKGWEELTIQINRATIALNNFTKEGLAAFIATIKMKFYPVLQDLYKSLETAGYYSNIVQAQINEVLNMQQQQISTATYGLEVYNDTLESLGGTTQKLADVTVAATNKIVGAWNKVANVVNMANDTVGTIATSSGGWGIKSLQTGGIVPKTGIYQLHQGEEVKKQSMINYYYSPSFKMTVQGGGNAQNIAYEMKKILDDNTRQFKRVSYELIPGRA